jgi:tRNA A-37 threonylcarbamoyl transferase component Bud32
MIGQAVGNYRITKLLGEGGMGAVYLAEHPQIARKAAVKVLHAELARDEEFVQRFFNEARAATTIRHPGIVEIFDFGLLPSGATYILMEFLEGRSLSARLRDGGAVPIAEAVELARQAASALGAAHAHGIVHRDLKPDNLFLVPDDRIPDREQVKVLDFGIAKVAVQQGGSGSVRTRTGAVMGTPLYMSPEQCRGTQEVDLRTDIYALGAILYEMLCGRRPFVSEGQGELLHMHIAVPPPPPRTHNPGIPRELEAIVLKTLEKDPARRQQSMAELEQALRGSPTTTAPGVAPEPVTGRQAAGHMVSPSMTTLGGSATGVDYPVVGRPRRWVWPAAIAVVLAAAGGTAGFVALKGRASPRPAVTAAPAPAAPAPAPALPAPAPALPAAAPAATPPPRLIPVAINSRPPGASVIRERDGALLGRTPFTASWPAGTGVEKLRLEAEGHRPHALGVALDRGLDTTIDLHRLPAVERPSRAPKPAPRSPAPAAPAKPKEPVAI